MTAPSRIALITGANRGIGRATALQLGRDGVDAIITYRSHAEEADAVVAELRARGRAAVALQLDVGDVASLDAFAAAVDDALQATWGRETFDILINNGGDNRTAPFLEYAEADFDHLVDVHFKGVFFLTQKLAGRLADGGRVVNLSSGLTRHVFPERAAYASVKGAVEVLTRYLAAELGPRGITVNTIAPGATATDFSGGVLRDTPALQEHVASITALGRHGVAEDVAGAIAALVAPGSRFVTGERLEVSGGLL
jgi:NAD(P)-dependent dehydrogenase (short-subunit alcohol dehydrogenase family)